MPNDINENLQKNLTEITKQYKELSDLGKILFYVRLRNEGLTMKKVNEIMDDLEK